MEQNKMKILFIGPRFNNYQKTIASTIRNSGKYSKVDYISDCPLRDIGIFATVTNLIPSIKSKLIASYNESIKRKIDSENYNIIFIIRGEFLNPDILKSAKKENLNLKIILYQWDSIRNNQNAKKLIHIADEAYTFDYEDSKNYNFQYVPLFYSWTESGIKVTPEKKTTIDIMSIGGFREHRMVYINEVKKICKSMNLTYKFHNFIRFGAFIKNRRKLGIKFADVNFNKISYKRYYSILQKSKVVLDIQSPTQSGLTMRTMETLSLGKKLITTNDNIKKEQFYNNHNIFIIKAIQDLYSQRFIEFLNIEFSHTSGLLSLSDWLKKLNIL